MLQSQPPASLPRSPAVGTLRPESGAHAWHTGTASADSPRAAAAEVEPASRVVGYIGIALFAVVMALVLTGALANGF